MRLESLLDLSHAAGELDQVPSLGYFGHGKALRLKPVRQSLKVVRIHSEGIAKLRMREPTMVAGRSRILEIAEEFAKRLLLLCAAAKQKHHARSMRGGRHLTQIQRSLDPWSYQSRSWNAVARLNHLEYTTR
jgi:hypothetical protein